MTGRDLAFASRLPRAATSLCALALLACAGCGESTSSTPTADMAMPAPDLAPDTKLADQLACWLTGKFDSGSQAIADPTYFKILLRICPVSVPDLAPRVLYVEQAVATTPKQPYRQRLYVVETRDSASQKVASRVYELADPLAAVGLCDDPTSLTLTAADAVERPGCVVELTWKPDAQAEGGGTFVGGTNGKECGSTMNGATYATTEVTLTAKQLLSWDRGYDDTDKQVWGATKGGYKFDRKTPLTCP